MNNQPSNPPAFPCPSSLHGQPNEGMTLRDYFATKAMQSILLLKDQCVNAPLTVAEFAYRHADAMLAEREKAEGHD